MDWITTTVEGAMGSPWIYLALFAVAMIDGFFPVVPSESLVITAGVYAASDGEPFLPLVMLVAAAGAFAGDHVSYFLGHRAGDRLFEHADDEPESRKVKGFRWARKTLEERGGTIIIVCRYIPGARTAVTLTSGAVRYPLRKFSTFDAIAAVSWGVYSSLVGYIGGEAFHDDPLKGLALGLGIAFTVAMIVELVRHVRGRAKAAA
jgi:membrane protein DedA with SNARE-associated domain